MSETEGTAYLPSSRDRKRGIVLTWTAALFLALVAARWLPAAAAVLGTVLTIALVAQTALVEHHGIRLATLAAAALVAALTITEIGVSLLWTPVTESYSRTFVRKDPVFGWRPIPGKTHGSKQRGSAIIYSVDYRLDSLGWRVLPPDDLAGPAEASAPCVVFFADSYTFGQGLEDNQTLPYRTQLLAQGRVRVINRSVPAYGAEQMLAALERGGRTTLPCRPTHVIYQALIDHVFRAAGLHEFSRRGPHYELGQGRQLDFIGTGWPASPTLIDRLPDRASSVLRESRLYQFLTQGRVARVSDADFERYLAIITRFQSLLETRYPGAQFHVLAWQPVHPYGMPSDSFLLGLRRVAPRVHVVNDIIPGYRDHPLDFQIPVDGHPNARADSVLSSYVTECILGVHTAKTAAISCSQ